MKVRTYVRTWVCIMHRRSVGEAHVEVDGRGSCGGTVGVVRMVGWWAWFVWWTVGVVRVVGWWWG